MQIETGEIREFKTDEDARAAGFMLPLNRQEADGLQPLTRSERRAKAREIVRDRRAERKKTRKAFKRSRAKK